jgi:hypothetical protein
MHRAQPWVVGLGYFVSRAVTVVWVANWGCGVHVTCACQQLGGAPFALHRVQLCSQLQVLQWAHSLVSSTVCVASHTAVCGGFRFHTRATCQHKPQASSDVG